ncbi:MAG: hypothetical protein RBR91_13440 [Porticoccaceae bacterium]|jgi:ribosomal protein L7/L12|nr:hypothetical protein [Porticoccaceae bacterium]
MNNDSPLPEAARQAADRGDLVTAIKLAREARGLGLREAKDAVEAHVRGRSPAGRVAPLAEGDLPLDAVAALHRGRFLDAVKLSRNATGLGLKASREAVDAYLARHPALDGKINSARAERRRTLLWWVGGILVIGIMLASLLSG